MKDGSRFDVVWGRKGTHKRVWIRCGAIFVAGEGENQRLDIKLFVLPIGPDYSGVLNSWPNRPPISGKKPDGESP